jgi:serine/threonine protein kinase
MSYTRFPTRFGEYILLDRITSGGMAEVYRAKALDLGQYERLVAIKCMLPQLCDDEQFVTMFIDEAKLAAQLSHENIVLIHELGRVHDRLYIAMELVFGHDARHVVRAARAANEALPLAFAAYVVSEVALALDYAHNKHGPDGKHLELVHRDVSPQNIMIAYDGAVKVTDFGIARAAVRDTETRAGVIKGKVAYMAPEQVAGPQIDHRADIFALGAVLYELVAGRQAFSGESEYAILEKVQSAAFAEIPDIPAALREVLHRAMAFSPDDRFQHAADMAEALSPFRIEEKSIYGAKRAAALMQSLYGREIELLPEKRREYAAVTSADVLENSARYSRPSSVELFESRVRELGPSAEATHVMEEQSDAARTMPVDFDAIEVSRVLEPPLPSRGGLILKGSVLLSLLIVAGAVAAVLVARPRQPTVVDTEYTPIDAPNPAAVDEPTPASETPPAEAGERVAASAPPHDSATPAVQPAKPASETPPAEAGEREAAPAPPHGFATPAAPDEAADVATPVAPRQPVAPDPPAPDAGEDDFLAIQEQHGFITIKARDTRTAKVVVDGVDIGFSPVVYHEIDVGEHIVEIVEQLEHEIGRTKTVFIDVKPTHTREAPLKVFVDF